MKNKNLVICDCDMNYAMRLSDYLRIEDINYEILVFSDIDVFVRECNIEEMDILLMEESFYLSVAEALEDYDKIRIIVLAENKDCFLENVEVVYKYQSAVRIMDLIGDDIKNTRLMKESLLSGIDKSLIGVYSPVNRSLKTSFCLAMGNILAEEKKVLYINLEGYNGLCKMYDIDSEYSLLDFMYEYSLNADKLLDILPRYVRRVEDIDMLVPARSPFEIMEIDAALWMSLISGLIEESSYRCIIIDIGDSINGTLQILRICGEIYIPVRKDNISQAKMEEFEDLLGKYPGGEDIREKMQRIKFPFFDDMDGNMCGLKHAKIGSYVSSIIGNDIR